jgi:mono/diheme cytochrome c family protein
MLEVLSGMVVIAGRALFLMLRRMSQLAFRSSVILALALTPTAQSPGASLTKAQLAELPPPAGHKIDFSKEIRPILETSCIKCHGRGKDKGGLKLETRETLLKGGDNGPAVIPGKSEESLLISLVQGFDPDSIMPKKGTRLTKEQIALLRAWIDQGLPWEAGVTFGRLEPINLKPRKPEIAVGQESQNPIDVILYSYFATNGIRKAPAVDDRIFARRAYLDIIGLLPPPEVVSEFIEDRAPQKRSQLVRKLLDQGTDYAEHWLTFWNDLLRNDYKGTGYIDGGRKQITTWLYSALRTNMPYNEFVAELIHPRPESEGFTKGIIWRGTVNASQTPQMQAAQNISQVFMGVNLKCASCHDSFINDLTLADAYGLAGVYSDSPLEMVRCDKPLGKTAEPRFFYPELGAFNPHGTKAERTARLAKLLTQPNNGRLSRTLVNRLWQRFFGRGLVEPVDEMEKPAWNSDLLDWLAEDFAAHGYDIKHLIYQIVTSEAYQLPAQNYPEQTDGNFTFKGPAVRRMSAEEFRDALTTLTGIGYPSPAADISGDDVRRKKFLPPIPIHFLWNQTNAAERAAAGHLYFRKTFHLDDVPEDATAAALCDNSFTLYINGREVGKGDDFKTAYVYDVRQYLRKGENLIAADAVNHLRDNTIPAPGQKVSDEQQNPAGFIFYARLRTTSGGKEKVGDFSSDKSWKCSEAAPKGWETANFSDTAWKHASVLGEMGMVPWRVTKDYMIGRLASFYPGGVRAALVSADSLTTALGRPNRDQTVTTRPLAATTLQALELTNGETLADILKRGAARLRAAREFNEERWVADIYLRALNRKPERGEVQLARQLAGKPVRADGVEDVLWAVTMLPEFQLIY